MFQATLQCSITCIYVNRCILQPCACLLQPNLFLCCCNPLLDCFLCDSRSLLLAVLCLFWPYMRPWGPPLARHPSQPIATLQHLLQAFRARVAITTLKSRFPGRPMASRKQRGWTVPGFGLPLRWPEMISRLYQPIFQPDENTLLLSALDGSEDPKFCYTVRELTILALINELTDMPDWDCKIFNPEFTFDRKSAKLLTGLDVTRSMLDWCGEEAKYYVHEFISTRIIPRIRWWCHKVRRLPG